MWILIVLAMIGYYICRSVLITVVNKRKKEYAKSIDLDYWIDYKGQYRNIDTDRIETKIQAGTHTIMVDSETFERRDLTERQEEREFLNKQREFQEQLDNGKNPRLVYKDKLLTTGQEVRTAKINWREYCLVSGKERTTKNYYNFEVYYDRKTGIIIGLTENGDVNKIGEVGMGINYYTSKEEVKYAATSKEQINEMINFYNKRTRWLRDVKGITREFNPVTIYGYGYKGEE